MVPTHFLHVSMNCRDPIAVERFYTKHFGFRRGRVVQLGDEQVVFTRSGNVYLEIFRATEEAPIPLPKKDGYAWPGWKHIAFMVDDVDAKLAEMGDDARIMLGPMNFDDFIPGWRSVWVADPEGNIIEISQGYKDQDNPPALPV
jgi:glyoxylase I family protein